MHDSDNIILGDGYMFIEPATITKPETIYNMDISSDTQKRICSCCVNYSKPTVVACRKCKGFDKFDAVVERVDICDLELTGQED